MRYFYFNCISFKNINQQKHLQKSAEQKFELSYALNNLKFNKKVDHNNLIITFQASVDSDQFSPY